MLEQKQLDSKKLIGKKEFAIFETSSTSACSTGTLCLGEKNPPYFTCILLIYSLRARGQILFKSDTKTLDISLNFVDP